MTERTELSAQPEKAITGMNTLRIGLRGRLLLGGEFLNPDRRISPDELIFDDYKTYDYAQKASDLERSIAWKNQPDDFNYRINSWTNQVVKAVKGSQGFFVGEEGERRRELVSRMGLETDASNEAAIKESAKKLYDDFLTPRKNEDITGVKAFMFRALQLYADAENRLAASYSDIERDLPVFAWLGGMFGDNSSQILSEMIPAVVLLYNEENDGEDFIESLVKKGGADSELRINRLTTDEKELLKFVYTAPTLLSLAESSRDFPKAFPIAPPLPIAENFGSENAEKDEGDEDN